jgi:hypothetical protein
LHIEQTEKEVEAEKASGEIGRSASQELRLAALHFLDEQHVDSACPVTTDSDAPPLLRAIALSGNTRSAVVAKTVFTI